MQPPLRLVFATFATFLVLAIALDGQKPSVVDQHTMKPSSLADAPSVHLHVTLKRQALEIHGYSEFDVFATPVVSTDNTSVFYDGYAVFVEGAVQFKYLFVDGVAYLVETNNSDPVNQTVQCFPSNIPFASAVSALNEAMPIPSASVGDEVVECTSGNLFKTSFDGADFALCVSDASGFVAFGSEMNFKVEYLDGHVDISAPRLNEVSCPVVKTSTFVTPTALALITGGDVQVGSSRNLKTAEHMWMDAPTCSCKSKPRPCIFFHGLGNENDEKELQDLSRHWGDMSKRTPCWKCSFGESTSWVSLSAPMTGSMASDYLQDFCNDEISSFATGIFELTGQCPMDPSRKSTSYQNEKYSSKGLNAAYIAAQEAYRGNITTALCSNSYVGVFSKYQAMSIIAGKSVPHKSPENDCLVEFQSCAVGLDTSLFGNSYTDKFYMPELNHADTSFRTRDALFKASQKPAKWFECLL
ncbi:hypothetical protein BBO99_00008305 [Phytophthora kernoviae]|uniref:Uncharacterized protein n=2 Tax=Phytophthora kernoviae TaxID=325452 RepID=A0A3R7GU96_9STRA|nr:hypothetical protein G195_009944 [Phytophthora kernoviae 00238/432]KAG2512450.1 hypothetical protein JM16_008041 [Phytophthora kernoviae]KAG2516554.1 hypothetical protein JM18_007939 [Phytophthora kernoviae]RLN46390.1 hypothetical protein BBI17_008556 [Phytophthora kernoviae]RLN75462.1 hypothetical protein BBO99_00008305 [Phytophthora kernoviae]